MLATGSEGRKFNASFDAGSRCDTVVAMLLRSTLIIGVDVLDHFGGVDGFCLVEKFDCVPHLRVWALLTSVDADE